MEKIVAFCFNNLLCQQTAGEALTVSKQRATSESAACFDNKACLQHILTISPRRVPRQDSARIESVP